MNVRAPGLACGDPCFKGPQGRGICQSEEPGNTPAEDASFLTYGG